MNMKIFASTFVLIFLAELGDKTQLAAMARAASEGSAKWTIFLAASAALVLSTLIAVLLGGTLTRLVPEKVIKISAGVLFVVFGLLILREAFVSREARPAAVEVRGVTAFVYRQAAAFERAAFEDYERLASQAEDTGLRTLLAELAAEEREHFTTIETVAAGDSELEVSTETAESLAAPDRLVCDAGDTDRPILERAIEHERATAGFYAELSRLTPVRALQDAFAALAAAELKHLDRLESFLTRDVDV